MNRWIFVTVCCLLLGGCSSLSPTADLGQAADAGADQAAKEDAGEIKFKTDAAETRVAAEIMPQDVDAGESDIPQLQCNPGEGCFLDKCNENSQCKSGWCVEHMGDGVCTQVCQEECPQAWACKQVGGDGPDVVWVCISNYANLCKPCTDSGDCKSVGAAEDVCVSYEDEGSFCGGSCQIDEDCPWGFSCEEGEGESTQCVSDAGVCPCADKSIELSLTTPCGKENDWGVCSGLRTCTIDGLSDCDAPMPAAEVCNGLDDDCDGEADEPDLVDGDYVNLCDDGNDCTEDKCTGEGGCVNEIQESGDCNDDNPCTVADHCVDGTCLGDPVECEDDNPCTDSVCTATGGCEYPTNSAACDDEDPCTVADQCVGGECEGTAAGCECQKEKDCAALEDGDLCNGTLFCNVAALPYKCEVKMESVVACPDPTGQDAFCQQSHCDPASGECSSVPNHQGFLCDNADACTFNSSCQNGECAGGDAINCNDGNACTADSCDEAMGCQNVLLDDGTLCGAPGWKCTDGICQCAPDCAGKNCGSDGCGSSCGDCDPEMGCVAGVCICLPDCTGKQCGDNGCGGSCGSCNLANQTCDAGQCKCPGVYCGGQCCLQSQVCSPTGECCLPQCQGKQCGDNDCGGTCGTCPEGQICHTNTCVDMTCDDGNEVDWDGCTNGQISEWQVNTTTLFNQRYPNVAAFPNGAHRVFWSAEYQGIGGGCFALMSQLYGPTGVAEGSETHVVDEGEKCGSEPVVAEFFDGRALLTWSGGLAQIYAADGGKEGPNFALNPLPLGGYRLDHIAVTATEGFVMVGETSDGSEKGVIAQLFASDGAPTSAQLAVNQYTLSYQGSPAVDVLPSGRFMVAWASIEQDGDEWGVFGRIFGGLGEPVGPEHQVNIEWADSQHDPTVSRLVGDQFVVAWRGCDDGAGSGACARVFDSEGSPQTGEIQLSTTTSGDQVPIGIAPLSEGGFVVVWIGPGPGGPKSLFLRVFDKNGEPQGNEVIANAFQGNPTYPQVRAFPDDSFIATWENDEQDGSGDGIFAQRFNPDGTKKYK